METKEDTPVKNYAAYLRGGNMHQVYDELLQRIDDRELQSASSALAIGSGSGEFELKFLSKLVPNLKKAVFVEPDESSFERLESNLCCPGFSDSVQTETYQCSIQEWKHGGERFDVIIMRHFLYFLSDGEQRDLMRTCVDQWLNAGGLLYITMMDDELHASNQGSLINTIYRHLGTDINSDITSIKKILLSIGKLPFKEYAYVARFKLESFELGAIKFIKATCKEQKSEEEIRRAIETAIRSGFDGYGRERVCVVRAAVAGS